MNSNHSKPMPNRIPADARTERRIALLNPNTNRDATSAMVASAMPGLPSGFLIEGSTVPYGVGLITDEASMRAAAPVVVESGLRLAEESFDGIAVAGFGDPGMEDLRRQVAIPVVGIAEAGMAEAAALGRRFSVVTTTPDLHDYICSIALRYGYRNCFASVRLTLGEPGPLMASPQRLEAALLRAAEDAVSQDGADAIIVGGGPLATAARAISGILSVPVIEPIPAAVRLLTTLIEKRSGDVASCRPSPDL